MRYALELLYTAPYTICSGWNTSSNFSAVKKPSSTQACFKEMLSLKAFFAVFGGVFIADIRVERRDQHQRIVQIVIHFVLVCGNAHGTVVVERDDRFGEQSCGLKEVVISDGHKHIQLKIALRCGNADCAHRCP